MTGKTNLIQPLKPINHQLPPLHDLIISYHVKHPQKSFSKNICTPMQSFSMKKVLSYFVVCGRGGRGGAGDTMFYLQTFPTSSSSFTFVVQTTTIQAKLPSHCF